MTETPTTTPGATQAAARFDLVASEAMLALAEAMGRAEGSGEFANWRDTATRDHINHALTHLFSWQPGQGGAKLEQAFCRLMMAVAVERGR